MRDPSEKGSNPEEVSPQETQNQSVSNETKKTCADCGTSKTPLWRGGPAGPKSLCNACGIRSSKKRRAFSGLNKGEDKKSKKGNSNPNNFSSSNTKNLGYNLKQSLSKILMQISKEQRRKFGEEEQAAILLMALSYGSVYA